MSGEGQVSASQRTLDEVNALNNEIGQLDTELQSILSTGNRLADGTNWQGRHRDDFNDAWKGRISANLRQSIEALREMNTDAETSATNIRAAGGIG